MGPLLLQLDSQGKAFLRPNGQHVDVRLIDEQHSRRDRNTISANDRVLLKLRGEQTNASVSGIAERNCPKNSSGSGCAAVSYQILMHVNHQGQRASLPAWGFCGCR